LIQVRHGEERSSSIGAEESFPSENAFRGPRRRI
jgi:hypothetical protein